MARVSKRFSIEQHEQRPLREVLRSRFEQLGTQSAVARSLGVDNATIHKWLKEEKLKPQTTLVDAS